MIEYHICGLRNFIECVAGRDEAILKGCDIVYSVDTSKNNNKISVGMTMTQRFYILKKKIKMSCHCLNLSYNLLNHELWKGAFGLVKKVRLLISTYFVVGPGSNYNHSKKKCAS